MGNSWWSSPFGLWASKHFIIHRALLKPFDHVTSEAAVFICIAVHVGRCERERRGAEASCTRGTAGGVCRTTASKGKKKPNHNQKTENKPTVGQRPLMLLRELSNISYKPSVPLSGRSYLETWSPLFASPKPSSRTAECFLFNGKLPRLHRNNPNQGHSLNPMDWHWLNRFDINQAPLSTKQPCMDMISTSPWQTGEFGVMEHLSAFVFRLQYSIALKPKW